MKHLSTALLILIVPAVSFSQKGYTRMHNQMLDRAKNMLANEEYEDAAKIYKQLLPVDPAFVEVYHEMGVCQWNIRGRKAQAADYFEKGVDGKYIESYYELARARHWQQRYDDAITLCGEYKQQNGRMIGNGEVDRLIGMCVTAKALVQDPLDVKVRNMGGLINSPAHDYCPLVTADGNTMYFTSRREGTTGRMKDPYGSWFEDIYMAKRIDEMWTNAVNAGEPLNTLVHDATVGLSPDGRSMIIYRTQQNLVSGDLYETRMHALDWQEPELMTSRINGEHHEPSASIAPTGQEIYFTSDRPGGFGGRDLYRIRRLPNGEWSLPLNLGPNVNTAHDEDAPFMHSDGSTLFFSSNGHNTMGGYDIFKTVMTDYDMNGWSTPVNMGFPLNTVNDDIYFCLSDDGRTGYFSSERAEGFGMQDIYQVTFPNSQLDRVFVRGVVADLNEEPVKARIILMDAVGEEIVGIYNTNQNTGRYLMVLGTDMEYQMSVEAPGYAPYLGTLVAQTGEGTQEMALDIVLHSIHASDGLSKNEE